jgi:uncharacterized membrane protein (GlpM family)
VNAYVLYRTVRARRMPYCRIVYKKQLLVQQRKKTMNVIVTLIVYLVVLGLIWWLVSMLPLPAPLGGIVRVLFIILAVMVVLAVFGIIPGGFLPRLNL